MGYTPNGGAKGQPTYNSDVEITSDLQAAVDFAAAVGNIKVGTTAQRDADTKVWEGLFWSDTTDKHVYRYTSGGWTVYLRNPAWVNLGYIANTQSPGFGYQPSYLLSASSVLLAGATQKISSGWDAGDVLFTLPAAARPTSASYYTAVGSGTSAATLQVLSTGVVSVKAVISGAPVWLSVDGWNIRL